MQFVVGIGEYAISCSPGDTIKTYALSTCIALTVYSPVRKVLGMVHIALPLSGGEKAPAPPGYYADTAVPFLIERVSKRYGCCIRELNFRLFGGARSLSGNDVFKIGERNLDAVRSLLASYHVMYDDSDTGGSCSRTIEADVATGTVRVEYQSLIL